MALSNRGLTFSTLLERETKDKGTKFKIFWLFHYMKFTSFILIEKGMPQLSFVFVVSTFNVLNVLYFYYLKSILNDGSIKEYICSMVFINLEYMLR